MIGITGGHLRPLATGGNRASIARRKKRKLHHRDWTNGVMQEARRLAQSLKSCPADQLRGHTDRLRKFTRADIDSADHHRLSLAAAGVIEAIRRTLDMNLFDVQLQAGIVISSGAVAEMQTGEGKTLSAVLPAYFHALAARGVHVATPNSYLATRDFEKLSPVFQSLGMSTGLLVDNAKPEQTRAAYQADVTYGPGHAFGFDYLRDQLTLSGGGCAMNRQSSIGSTVWERLAGNSRESKLLQRGLYASIVDEIDHVLIDDAVSPLLLSGSGKEEAADADVHRSARDFANRLTDGVDYSVLENRGTVTLSEAGFDRVYDEETMTVHPQLVRPWHEYVTLALRAAKILVRDVNYVIREGEIQIVDASTGRIFEDRTWSDGLHQAVQANENLKITAETLPLARITRQRFYRYYQSLGGMTGTASGCEAEFSSVYGLPVVVIPLRIPTNRRMLSEHVTLTCDDKLLAIADETAALHRAGRAVLIGTLNIAESIAVADELQRRGLSSRLLNGIQDADEASIIAQAGQPGAITVATNLAGRGTDIGLHSRVAELGGLHVIVTQKHSLARVDRQLIGRCARCGDPGTARVYISAEDSLPAQHAPWIQRAIRRGQAQNDIAAAHLHRRLARVQESLQRHETSQRWRLLQTDQENEKLLTKRTPSPNGCWQL